jgi:hypothetical protein
VPGGGGDEIIVFTGATTGIGRAAAPAVPGRANRLIRHGLDREPDIGDLPHTARTRMWPDGEPVYLGTDDSDLAVDVAARHPGMISTRFPHAMFSLAGDPPERATAHVRYVATRRDDNGTCHDERDPAPPDPRASDLATQDGLPDITSRILRDHLDPTSTSRR